MRYSCREEEISMDKNMTLNLHVNPDVKHNAEMVLSQLGIQINDDITVLLLLLTAVNAAIGVCSYMLYRKQQR